MANPSTISAVYGLAGPTSSSETAVQFPTGYLGPAGASTSGTPLRAVIAVPPNCAAVTNRLFKVRTQVAYVASGAGNITVNLYWNCAVNTNLTTFTSDVLLAGTGALAMASGNGNTGFEVICSWDSVTGRLAAMWNESAGLSNIITTPAIVKSSAAVTATNPISASGVTSSGLIQVFTTITCSANATSTTLTEMAIEQI